MLLFWDHPKVVLEDCRLSVLGRHAFIVGAMIAAVTFASAPRLATAATLSPTASCSACGHNLIANPGADRGRGANCDCVVKVPDWQQSGDFTAEQYASAGDLSSTSPGPKARGKNYFYGGPYALKSIGTQLIKVGTGGISNGRVRYVLSGWLGGYADQGDNATLYVTFENSAGTRLSEVSIGPATVAQRHSISELLYRQRTGSVPSATRQIKVELVMVKLVGGDDDGLADTLSLVFSE